MRQLMLLVGCVDEAAAPDEPFLAEPSIDDVRGPCVAKASSTSSAVGLDGAFARIVGDLSSAPYGVLADVIGDVDGDGCADIAVAVTEWSEVDEEGFRDVASTYVLLFRGPFDSGVFTASQADARIEVELDRGGFNSVPRNAGDTNRDGRSDLWIVGHLLESPFQVDDDLERATARLMVVGEADITGGFDADGDGHVDALAVYPPPSPGSHVSGAALYYGPFVGPVSAASLGPTDQSLYLSYGGDLHSQDRSFAPWAGTVGHLTAALLSYDYYMSGVVIDVSGDRRGETLDVTGGEGVILEAHLAVSDATGDGVVDFVAGGKLCDGAVIVNGGGTESACATALGPDGTSSTDVDGDSAVEIVVPSIGLVSVATGTTFPAPDDGVDGALVHQGDLTGDGRDDLVLSEQLDGLSLGSLRIYSGAELAGNDQPPEGG